MEPVSRFQSIGDAMGAERGDDRPSEVADRIAGVARATEWLLGIEEPDTVYERELREGNFSGAFALHGRNNGPMLLEYCWKRGILSWEDLRNGLLLDVWNSCEFPLRSLPRPRWLKWFRGLGFVSADGSPAPNEPMTVWRGQVGRTLGLSWSRDRARAKFFHSRNKLFGFEDARLLPVTVEPRHVLATLFGEDHRGEEEVIVDPAGMVGRYVVESD